ncbi:hypothetical protein ABEB36_008801 [Hypothenemus hampei]|uniref:ZAD domain-containing protein n=1 Tax=Hypothenemus hampei TaxID=57062 RepID=A0ABD1EN56_HYPHA
MSDKKPKCFVPECTNNIGVLLPKNNERKKEWLKALGLINLTPCSKSFICLDHFGENGQPISRQKIVKPTSQHIHETRKNSLITQNLTVYSVYEKMCRLCMVQSTNVTQHIFNKLNAEFTIAQAIGICLYPLQVLPNDMLSKYVCTNCLNFLKEYFTFHQNCMTNDSKQRYSLDIYNDCPNSLSDEYLYEEWLSDYEDPEENQEDESLNESDNRAMVLETSRSELSKEQYAPHEVYFNDVIEKEQIMALDDEDSSELVDTIFSDTEEDNVENIVIEIVNDEEPATTQKENVINTSKRLLKIENVENRELDKQVSKRNSHLENTSSRRSITVMKNGDDEIYVLPTAVTLMVKEKYKSPLGYYSSELIKYLFDSMFLLAGEYLYEMGLKKGNSRRLLCIVSGCCGVAIQSEISTNKFSKKIEVIESHNHKVPDALERKKQMFYHAVQKKIRSKINVNLISIYNKYCLLDPSLKQILPIKIFTKQMEHLDTTPLTHSFESFDQFYDSIELDDFHGIHFTDNHVQFYQDRLDSKDGGKAVIFGNQEIIKQLSNSKTMFVDSSFVIEVKDFPSQLLTVLVWNEKHDSYYPIIFALTNMKSQELYEKVFTFVFNELAPDLRPSEIITEYEANLYYALSGTYLESSIGGSVFYFTQSIFKKICSLDLDRILETNLSLRSIYNMILMLPLLPLNSISDGYEKIKNQAQALNLQHLTDELFAYVCNEWLNKVTPELFCVHRLENRINEEICVPFEIFRDLLAFNDTKKPKISKFLPIISVLEKLIEFENLVRKNLYGPSKIRDNMVPNNSKKIIIEAWDYIDNQPTINIYQIFLKVLPYMKSMETQLCIWGVYSFSGQIDDTLIDVRHFSIIKENILDWTDQEQKTNSLPEEEDDSETIEEYYIVDNDGTIKKSEVWKSLHSDHELAFNLQVLVAYNVFSS